MIGDVEGAAEQALDHAVIVGGREQLDFRDAEWRPGSLSTRHWLSAQAVGFVLAAEQADAQDVDVLGESRRWTMARATEASRMLRIAVMDVSFGDARFVAAAADGSAGSAERWSVDEAGWRAARARRRSGCASSCAARCLEAGRGHGLGERLLEAVGAVELRGRRRWSARPACRRTPPCRRAMPMMRSQ